MTAVVIMACVVNIGFAIRYTNPAKGPEANGLTQRYGELHDRLAETSRVAYFSDNTVNFVGARFAMAPVVLDIRYVDFRLGDRVVSRFDLDGLVEDAVNGRPVDVVGDFSDPKRLHAFVRELRRVARKRNVDVGVIWRRDGLILVAVGG
jgi:hypothetical protein